MKTIHTTNIAKTNDSPRGVMRHLSARHHFTWRIITILIVACSCFAYLSGEARSADVVFTVNNSDTVLELTVPSTVSLNLAPTSGRAFNTQDLSIAVGTNNLTGYTLKMQASSATLTHTTDTSESAPVISPMLTTGSATGYTAAQFEAGASDADTLNRWGYKLSSATNFMPMTTDELILASTEAADNANTTTLNFAAKVDSSQAPGTYATTLTFTAVVNALPLPKTYMQDLTTSAIATLLPNTGDTATVYDSRDEQEYTIAKLADGNYWLLDNLALDLTDSNVQAKMLNSSDTLTNASYETLGYLFGSSTGTSSDQYATSAVSTNWNSTNSYSDPRIYTASKDTASSGWKYGIYYNYCAASAGSYCYGSGGSSGISSGNATEDICPSGWKMPTGDTANKSYDYLYYTGYSGDRTNFVNAFHPPLSGYVDVGSPYSQGSYGSWWSSTRYNDNYMYRLYVDSSSVYPQNYGFSRYIGVSMRCVWGS